jgi:hypothetical protein
VRHDRIAWGIVTIGMATIGMVLVGRIAVAGDASAPPAAAPGMRVYIDPKTGEPTTPPPGAAVEAAPAVQQRSGEGLVEETLPGGGVKVDLQGRFKTPLVVTVGPDGRARVGHAPSSNGGDAQ